MQKWNDDGNQLMEVRLGNDCSPYNKKKRKKDNNRTNRKFCNSCGLFLFKKKTKDTVGNYKKKRKLIFELST